MLKLWAFLTVWNKKHASVSDCRLWSSSCVLSSACWQPQASVRFLPYGARGLSEMEPWKVMVVIVSENHDQVHDGRYSAEGVAAGVRSRPLQRHHHGRGSRAVAQHWCSVWSAQKRESHVADFCLTAGFHHFLSFFVCCFVLLSVIYDLKKILKRKFEIMLQIFLLVLFLLWVGGGGGEVIVGGY